MEEEDLRVQVDVLKELSKILRGEVVDGLEGEKKDFIGDAVFDRKPMELLQDRCYMTGRGGTSNDSGGRVLNKLQFMEGFVG